MNDFEARRAARKARQADRAARLEAISAGYLKRAMSYIDGIPPGQPILVGHHSERHHRRALERHDTAMRKGIEFQKMAAEAKRRALTESAAISSDDPDAPEKIKERIADLERGQEHMKAVNAAWRRAGRPVPNDANGWGLIAIKVPLTTEECHRIRLSMARDPLNRGPFPTYALTNNSANMKRLKDRLAVLERAAAEAPRPDVEGDGYRITENRDENRLCIVFDAIPPKEVRTKLKSSGFRWSPNRGAWVRQLNNAARYAAEYALRGSA